MVIIIKFLKFNEIRFPINENNNSFCEKSNTSKALISIEIEWVNSLQEINKENKPANLIPILKQDQQKNSFGLKGNKPEQKKNILIEEEEHSL